LVPRLTCTDSVMLAKFVGNPDNSCQSGTGLGSISEPKIKLALSPQNVHFELSKQR